MPSKNIIPADRLKVEAALTGILPGHHIHEACGIFSIYAKIFTDAASLTYYAFCALQHHSGESAGTVDNDDGLFTSYRDIGLVSDVFPSERLAALGSGSIAVGHVRYGTTGSSVHIARQRAGAFPAPEHPVQADIAIGVPESWTPPWAAPSNPVCSTAWASSRTSISDAPSSLPHEPCGRMKSTSN